MNETLWNQVRNTEVRGVVSKNGYQISLITRLLKAIHNSSNRCLDLLEYLYTQGERLNLTWNHCDAIVEAIVNQIEHGKMTYFGEDFCLFWQRLAEWLETIGVNDLRAVEIGLAVIMNPKLKANTRRGSLRDALLSAFDDVEGDAWLIDAEVPKGVKNLQIPPYFPFATDKKQYEVECLELIRKHIKETDEAYHQKGFSAPNQHSEQEKHLRIIAEFCITRLSLRKLEMHLTDIGVIDLSTDRAGISPSNLSEIIKDFEKNAGVQLRRRA